MITAPASGHPVYQFNLWVGGENRSRQLLHEAAAELDQVLGFTYTQPDFAVGLIRAGVQVHVFNPRPVA